MASFIYPTFEEAVKQFLQDAIERDAFVIECVNCAAVTRAKFTTEAGAELRKSGWSIAQGWFRFLCPVCTAKKERGEPLDCFPESLSL